MARLISIFAVFCLFAYCNIAVASSGAVPPSASKKGPVNIQTRASSPKPQTAKTAVVKKTALQKKKNKPLVAITQKKVSRTISKNTAVDKELLKKTRLIKQKRAALNNSKWDIEVLPLKGGEKIKDAAIFKDNKVAVESLLDKGFSYTNYTLTVKDNGVIVWETMQTSNSGEVVFIRGEVASDITSMHGIISFPKGGSSVDYSFKSVSKQVIRK